MKHVLLPVLLTTGWLWMLVTSPAHAQTAIFSLYATAAAGGTESYRVAVADINSDTHLDAVVANTGNGSVGLLLGNGKGGFSLLSTLAVGAPRSNAYDTFLADVNSDGKPDILTILDAPNGVTVLPGDGRAGFGPKATYQTGTGANSSPRSLAVCDINGDGRPDLLTANDNNTLGILLGDGAGGFALQANSPSIGLLGYASGMAVADINGDANQDVVIAFPNNYPLGILLSDGKGSFVRQPDSPLTSGDYYSVAIADANGDGYPDLLAVNRTNATLDVLPGNGRGQFFSKHTYPTDTQSYAAPLAIAATDVNGDGWPDALLTNLATNTLGVLLNDKKGNFTLQANSPATGQTPLSVTAADVNGDGKPDALTTNGNGTLSVLLNTTTALPTRAALPGTSARLYPNPARTSATLTLAGLPATATQAQATLLDAVGRVVGRHPLAVTGGSLPLAGLRPGLYVLQLAALGASGQVLGALPAQRLAVE